MDTSYLFLLIPFLCAAGAATILLLMLRDAPSARRRPVAPERTALAPSGSHADPTRHGPTLERA